MPAQAGQQQHQPPPDPALAGLPDPADDDYTDTVASYLTNPVLVPGSAEYTYSCTKLQYMVDKARADAMRAAGGAAAAAELGQLDARVEDLRKEAIAQWEVANAGRQSEACYDLVGLRFLHASAPK